MSDRCPVLRCHAQLFSDVIKMIVSSTGKPQKLNHTRLSQKLPGVWPIVFNRDATYKMSGAQFSTFFLYTHQQPHRIWPIVSKRNAWQRPKWVERQFLEQGVEVQHLIKWFTRFQVIESKLFSFGFIGQAGMAMFKIRFLFSEILIWRPSGSSKPFGLLLAWTSL